MVSLEFDNGWDASCRLCDVDEKANWAKNGWPSDDDPWGSPSSWAQTPPPLSISSSSSEWSLLPLPEDEASKLLLKFVNQCFPALQAEEVIGGQGSGSEEDPILLD